jgi:hypothetical protein
MRQDDYIEIDGLIKLFDKLIRLHKTTLALSMFHAFTLCFTSK